MKPFAITALMCIALCAGCATARMEQYFLVYEPDTRSAAVYKVTIQVNGFGGEYKLSEGYVPSSVVDALTGNLKEPSDLYASSPSAQERAEFIADLQQRRHEELRKIANTGSYGPGSSVQVEEATRFFGSLMASAALDENDQISVGQTSSFDPYRYRKLVYFCSNRVIPIETFATELDAVEKSSIDLANAVKAARIAKAARAKARAAERRQRREAVLKLINTKNAEYGGDLSKWKGTDLLELFATLQGLH